MPGTVLLSYVIIKVTPWGWHYPPFAGDKTGWVSWFEGQTAVEWQNWDWDRGCPRPTVGHSHTFSHPRGMRPWGLQPLLVRDWIVILCVFSLLVLRDLLSLNSSPDGEDISPPRTPVLYLSANYESLKSSPSFSITFPSKAHLLRVSGNTQMSGKEWNSIWRTGTWEKEPWPTAVENTCGFMGQKWGISEKGTSQVRAQRSLSAPFFFFF